MSDCLLPPVSEKVRFCGNFARDVNNLSSERILQLNQKIDRFCTAIENDALDSLPASDGFKKIKSKTKGDLTHELYAWSDADAKRIYGKFAGPVFEMHELGKHLQ